MKREFLGLMAIVGVLALATSALPASAEPSNIKLPVGPTRVGTGDLVTVTGLDPRGMPFRYTGIVSDETGTYAVWDVVPAGSTNVTVALGPFVPHLRASRGGGVWDGSTALIGEIAPTSRSLPIGLYECHYFTREWDCSQRLNPEQRTLPHGGFPDFGTMLSGPYDDRAYLVIISVGAVQETTAFRGDAGGDRCDGCD